MAMRHDLQFLSDAQLIDLKERCEALIQKQCAALEDYELYVQVHGELLRRGALAPHPARWRRGVT